MMEYTHYTGLDSLFQALAAGVVMGIYYDVFRILRRIVHFTGISVALQDLLFWLSSAVYIFFVCIKLNNGFIRIYFVFFALVGWGAYYFAVAKFIFAVFDYIIDFFRSALKKIKQGITSAVIKIIYKRCIKS